MSTAACAGPDRNAPDPGRRPAGLSFINADLVSGLKLALSCAGETCGEMGGARLAKLLKTREVEILR
jgi:hypothetical protein